MEKYDTDIPLGCKVRSGPSKIDNFSPSSNIFKLCGFDNSFPENEESVEINLNESGENSLSDTALLMGCSPNFNNETDGNYGLTSSSIMEASERNVNIDYHGCDVDNTSPPRMVASPEEGYLEGAQSNNVSEVTSCSCKSRHQGRLPECKDSPQSVKWTNLCDRVPRKPRIISKRTLQISMEPEKRWSDCQDSVLRIHESSDSYSSSFYENRSPGPYADAFNDDECSEDYCSSVPPSSPIQPSRYSVSSTNKSCSSCRYLVKRKGSGKSQQEPLLIKVGDCDGNLKVNFELPPPSSSRHKRRFDEGILCRDKGNPGTTRELESSCGDSGFEIILRQKEGNQVRLKDDSKNCFTGASNSECQVITRTKSCTDDFTFCCRPCKGRAGTKLGRGEPCYRRYSCSTLGGGVSTSNAWFGNTYTPILRDNCVQTFSELDKRHQWVQCVELSCQSTDQCCQTPVSTCSVEFECQPQVKQNPCKGCRPCSICFIPRNCSAAIPRWRSTVAQKGSPCCDDDACSTESIYIVPEKKPSNDGVSSHCGCALNHCEVDVEFDPEVTPILPEDTDTSTISSSIMRLGLAAASSPRYITREVLMKK
ncbi:hypothetical protein EGR_07108 [Echinococcus granulosus]|uniref:Uncharacterized protein n=1 Tax=Echinococcus granulosus TaxID=6210 RepID=W6UIQ2_ECHGR|nr:hypothetical protein EGR_07108 [Echinococcus granulosus]EUB58002.1 hypothetical protein EGR_07108 [Echinococcus granulosus]